MRRCIVRFEFEGTAITGDCLVQESLPPQRGSQIGMIDGLRGIHADRFADQVGRHLWPVILICNDAEQVKAVRMARIHGQHLPVELLGFVQASSLMALQRGIEYRLNGGRRCCSRRLALRLFCPALLSVHECLVTCHERRPTPVCGAPRVAGATAPTPSPVGGGWKDLAGIDWRMVSARQPLLACDLRELISPGSASSRPNARLRRVAVHRPIKSRRRIYCEAMTAVSSARLALGSVPESADESRCHGQIAAAARHGPPRSPST